MHCSLGAFLIEVINMLFFFFHFSFIYLFLEWMIFRTRKKNTRIIVITNFISKKLDLVLLYIRSIKM